MNHFTIFTETLEDYIIKENTTVYQFAKNVGLSGQAITNWLNRIGYPNTESANKIANYLCVSLDFLFGLSDSPKPNNDANDLPFLEKFDLLRKKNRVSCYAVAKECSFGESAISKWRKGKQPKLENVIQIAKYFGCSLDYLIGKKY